MEQFITRVLFSAGSATIIGTAPLWRHMVPRRISEGFICMAMADVILASHGNPTCKRGGIAVTPCVACTSGHHAPCFLTKVAFQAMIGTFTHKRKVILRHVAGILFIVLGIAGLVLPILQGILFLGIGTLLLAPEIPFFHRVYQRVEHRFPRIGRIAHHWHQRFHKEE